MASRRVSVSSEAVSEAIFPPTICRAVRYGTLRMCLVIFMGDCQFESGIRAPKGISSGMSATKEP